LLPQGQYLKNWRPITLSNTLSKIASGSIASSIKRHQNRLINHDQTDFIPNRYIEENTRLIYDIMHYTKKENIPDLLLLIDFEKKIDTVSWDFIDKVLIFFNFRSSV
jgi:hypothetical protein